VARYGAWNPVALQYDGLMASTVDTSLPGGSGGLAVGTPLAGASNGRTWVQGFAGRSTVDLAAGYTDYEQDMAGLAAGMDWAPTRNFIAGATIAFADSQVEMDKAAMRSDTEIVSGTIYATAFSDDAWIEGGLYFGGQDYVGSRTLTVGDTVLEAANKHDGHTTMVFFGGGRTFERDGWTVEPYGTLYYFDIREDAFEEAGAGDLNQIVSKKTIEALTAELGTTFNWLRPTVDGTLDWHLALGYNHDFEIDDAAISYAYQGAPTSFLRIADRNMAGGSAVLGAGIAYIKERTVLSLDYRGQSNRDYQHHVIGARLSYAFD
jgi:outer membrane autotransporter protein